MKISSGELARRKINMKQMYPLPFLLKKYIEGKESATQFSDHRLPISEGCNIWRGESPLFAWDYVLKLEEMSLWLDCLLKELNLIKIIGSGWGKYGNESLFQHDTEILNKKVHEVLPSILGKKKWKATKTFSTGHERKLNRSISVESVFTPNLISTINRILSMTFKSLGTLYGMEKAVSLKSKTLLALCSRSNKKRC